MSRNENPYDIIGKQVELQRQIEIKGKGKILKRGAVLYCTARWGERWELVTLDGMYWTWVEREDFIVLPMPEARHAAA